MATIKDVAKLAGVSTATVSATINNSAFVSAALRARVQQAIEALGYAPDRRARSLKMGSTNLIGLIIADITNPYFGELIHEIEAVAQEAGYSVLLSDTDQDPGKDALYISLMRTYRVDGMILAPSVSTDGERLAQLITMPTVLVDRRVPGLEVDFSGFADREAAMMATEYLLRLGHRRIANVAGPQRLTTGSERLEGYREALARHGVRFDERFVAFCDFREEAAFDATLRLLAEGPKPTAVFVANNLMLIGVMRALAQINLRCPEDVSIISIDDFPWANAFKPRLTVVRQPVHDIARDAIHMLLDRLSGKRSGPPVEKVHTPELVVRDSIRPAST